MRLRTHLESLNFSSLLITLQLLLFFCFSNTLYAQGWERSYEVPGYENARTEYLTLTQDGGFCVLATVEIPLAQDIAVIKLDIDGNLQWMNTYGGPLEDRGARIYQLDDGGYIIGGLTFNNTVGSGDYYLLRLDAFGNELWSKNYGTSAYEDFNGLVTTPDGGFVLMGELPPFYNKMLLIKVDADGNEEWLNSIGQNVGKNEGRDIKYTSDGGYIVSGFTKPLGSQDDEDFYIVKLDSQGNEEWHFKTGDQYNEFGEDVIETQDGGFVSTGYKMFDDGNEGDLYLIKVDANGDSLWAYTFGAPLTWERGFTITEAPNGDLIAAGNSTVNNEGFGYWVRTDSEGNLLQEKFLTESNAIGYPGNILPTPDNGFIVSGTGDSIVALIKTDSLLNSFTTYIQGNIFHDVDDDCQFDSGEESLEGWMVIADGDEDYFSITDAQGNYSVLVDTGDYILRVISPNELWETCPTYEAFPLILNDLFDTTQLDIPIQSVVDCPHLTVDISAPQLRRCFDNTYYIKYCNDGTLDEADAFVEVQFDSYLTVNSSNLSYTDLGGNLFSFDVGNVGVGECGEFSVSVYVDCDSTVLGQSHCVEAHIFPDSFCLIPMTVWDSSSFTVNGICEGDSVVFEFQNIGTAPPSVPRVASIIQDDIIVLVHILDLNPGQLDSIVLYPQGATLRAEVQQSEGHPGVSMPTAIVEGCGALPANWSLGFVTQFPMDDGNHFVDMDCQENVGSYDPNDKAAYPTGYFNENFINSEDEIEYHIRFQNTGTDTAFTVVIRDTLSEFLDPTSIRAGASSHDYKFELLNNGIIKFTFDNILLPDSSTNLVGSNGFVKFKIAQQPDNPPGTVITNSAAIYFDFNLPIITNEVFHTIEIPTEYLVHEKEICEGEICDGVVIEGDTILVDTVETSFSKDVHLTLIYLLEHSYSDSSIVLNSGDIFDGEIIFQDTVIILQEVAVNGCDSFQTVEISVDVDDPFKHPFEFKTHPNPVEDIFFIEYSLPKKDFVTIELHNTLGQKVVTLLDNQLQSSGSHRLQVNATDLSGNILFVHWKSDSTQIVEKLIISK